MSGETRTYATYKEFCGNREQPWVTRISEAVNWTQQETTPDQARIEAVLDTMAVTGASILHVGVGNSNRRLGARPVLRRSGQLVQKRSGYELAPWAPITGDNLFTRESGAVASQFHDPPAIEPYSSELVGAARGIVLGKKSGLDSIRIKVAELGLDVSDDRYPTLLESVKRAGTKKRGLVTDAEFRRLVSRERARRA